ncbi:hypothetical protein, partial [Corynebacterium cystitidis]|uniref:hypothetical protein n=1 Tax=Corynebacterium cystitidis TaxID=35757 RepID=UPI00211E0467
EYNPRTHPIKETNITPNQKETIPQTTTPTHQKNPDTNNQHPPKKPTTPRYSLYRVDNSTVKGWIIWRLVDSLFLWRLKTWCKRGIFVTVYRPGA